MTIWQKKKGLQKCKKEIEHSGPLLNNTGFMICRVSGGRGLGGQSKVFKPALCKRLGVNVPRGRVDVSCIGAQQRHGDVSCISSVDPHRRPYVRIVIAALGSWTCTMRERHQGWSWLEHILFGRQAKSWVETIGEEIKSK